jgi:hypothetical protein
MRAKNPFKLFGSYIGLAAGLITGYFAFAIPFYLCEFYKCNFLVIFIPIIPIVLGFFIGYFIHLIILFLLGKNKEK